MGSCNAYSVVDLFCGTGALSYGLHAKNKLFTTVAGIDIDPEAVKTAAANHKSALIVCDKIENVAPSDLLARIGGKKIDLIVGGPPCQGFSSLRPSRGQDLDDPRNSLYMQFVKYVAEIKPTAFLLENVVGLVSAGDGRLLESILKAFSDTGYLVDWRILNAANFGIPQKRERFFLLGVKKDGVTNCKIQFPSPTHKFSGRVIGTRHKANYLVNYDFGQPAIGVWDAISDLPSLASGERSDGYRCKPKNEYQLARRANSNGTVSLHEAANHSDKMLEIIRYSGANINSIPEGLVTSGYSSCYSRLEKDEPSTTITVKFTSPASSKCIHPLDNRSITPREAARLQGFDDDFEFCGSKTSIASQIGNAVPPLFGGIFAEILDEILRSAISTEVS